MRKKNIKKHIWIDAKEDELLKKKSKQIAPSNDDNPIEFIVKWIQKLK